MEKITSSDYRNSEWGVILMILLFTLGVLKLVFYDEPLFRLVKIVLAFFGLFVIPGYCITLFFKSEIEFIERVIISIPLSVAVVGISSYYLGLSGIGLRVQSWSVPVIIIFILLAGVLKMALKINLGDGHQ